jgi:MFS family permease
MRELPTEAPLDPRITRRFHWAAGFNGLAFGLEISALPLYFLTFGLPPALYGLLVGSAWLVALLVRVPIGALALRIGNRPLMQWGCWSFAGLTWALALASSVPALFAVRVSNGVARSFMVLPLRSWFTELCPRGELHKELGRFNSWYSIGQQLVGLLAGPLVLGLFGPQAVLGLLGLLPLLIWWVLRPAPPDFPAASASAAAGRGAPWLLWVAAPCGLAAMSALTALAGFIPKIILDIGWSQETVGLLLFAQGVSAVIFSRLNGRLVDRWGEASIALAGLTLVSTAAIVLYTVPTPYVLPVVAALSGAAGGTLPTMAMAMAARSLPSRSQGISIHETYISLGLGSGPFIGGLLTEQLGTPHAAMLGSIMFALVGLVGVLRVREKLAKMEFA